MATASGPSSSRAWSAASTSSSRLRRAGFGTVRTLAYSPFPYAGVRRWFAVSVAYRLIPDPDWATTTTVSLPEGLDVPADRFARAVFQARSVPAWGKALFVAREVA